MVDDWLFVPILDHYLPRLSGYLLYGRQTSIVVALDRPKNHPVFRVVCDGQGGGGGGGGYNAQVAYKYDVGSISVAIPVAQR